MNVLNDMNSTKESWNVVVRVLRLWCVQDFTKQKIPFFIRDGATRSTNIIGILTERELTKEGKVTKMNVISIDCDGFRIQCTLFGTYVDKLNAFLSTGEVDNAVISIEFAKVKFFRDNIYVQNCIDCTRVEYNVLTEEALLLKKSQLCESSKQIPEDEFHQTTTRNTIAGLKDCREVNTFIVLATIKHVVDDDDWWYTACICNKTVYPDSKMFFCEKCNKHVIKVTLRYKVQLRVIDDTDSTTFMLFDREASSLLSKSCVEMFESHDKNGNLPNEFAQILEKKVLFKVDSKMDKGFRFEQTFRVKKLCG
ncbi:hypothetical protein PHAVU_L003637 [Phaseolus vulgaris]|uniref:Uncharacterized protein n=2 Tax=Phaseolus vulgaris TaxID=3885 RepID=A0ACC3P1K8_PHAVU|nr:hypothetical protein PHAVU_006G008900g [Phaseolus vulgaris]ESW18047.1 hypothetical protein PHAVU_006G008900g [Phaseolus vulgaris]